MQRSDGEVVEDFLRPRGLRLAMMYRNNGMDRGGTKPTRTQLGFVFRSLSRSIITIL